MFLNQFYPSTNIFPFISLDGVDPVLTLNISLVASYHKYLLLGSVPNTKGACHVPVILILPAELIVIFVVATSDAPVLNCRDVAFTEDENVPSEIATTEAANKFASDPAASKGA